MGDNQLTGVIYSILVEKTKGTLLRNWDDLDLWMLAENVEDSVSQQSIELNENQQLLLEDIQDVASYHEDKNLLGLIWVVGQRIVNKSDIKRFSNDEIMQVLAAFAEWGMKQ